MYYYYLLLLLYISVFPLRISDQFRSSILARLSNLFAKFLFFTRFGCFTFSCRPLSTLPSWRRKTRGSFAWVPRCSVGNWKKSSKVWRRANHKVFRMRRPFRRSTGTIGFRRSTGTREFQLSSLSFIVLGEKLQSLIGSTVDVIAYRSLNNLIFYWMY